MVFILFLLYTLLGCLWIITSNKVKKTGIRRIYFVLFYFLKIGSGSFYGYWYARTTSGTQADTWRFHEEGLKEYHLLLNDPGLYFSSLFHNTYESGWWLFFTPRNSYWNDLRDNLMVKFVSLLNLFSQGNYYVNVILYTIITFWAYIYLLQAFQLIYPRLNRLTHLFILLSPSCFFWTSGIHKDGLLFLFLSIVIAEVAKIIQRKSISLSSAVLILIILFAIFPFRNYVTLGLLPACISIFLIVKRVQKNWVIVAALYSAGLLLFWGGKYLHPKLNFPQKIAYRQLEFSQLEGQSRLTSTNLSGNLTSFIEQLPLAISHSLFSPLPGTGRNLMESVASLEVLLLMILLLLIILKSKPAHQDQNLFVLFLLLFSIPMLLLIGYTVPFSGSIVRYRAIYYEVFMCLLAQHIQWDRFRKSH